MVRVVNAPGEAETVPTLMKKSKGKATTAPSPSSSNAVPKTVRRVTRSKKPLTENTASAVPVQAPSTPENILTKPLTPLKPIKKPPTESPSPVQFHAPVALETSQMTSTETLPDIPISAPDSPQPKILSSSRLLSPIQLPSPVVKRPLPSPLRLTPSISRQDKENIKPNVSTNKTAATGPKKSLIEILGIQQHKKPPKLTKKERMAKEEAEKERMKQTIEKQKEHFAFIDSLPPLRIS